MCGSSGGNGVGERNHLRDGELLGAKRWLDSTRPGDIPPENPPELFAALCEDALGDGGKVRRVRGEGVREPGDGDHCARHIGPRPEALARECGDVADLREGLGDDADLAIVLGTRSGGEPIRDLSLDRDKETVAARMIDQQREDERGGCAVGEIRDERERTLGERGDSGGGELSLVLEAVAFDQGEARSMLKVCAEAFAVERCEAGVEFAGDDSAAAGQELFGEGAGAGADLEHEIAGTDRAGIDELADQVVVDEKVLTE